ncbi:MULTISPECIES: hypothetical protein [unclassified Acidovorax]|uniref:hypothetical protein n=1 Tax=unclassified Acidovorax TaxID=2684926 RepID=UPI001C437E70|nr:MULTISPECIES: hypothetical protein [unclassified Acidovorax]MBV7427992.1 hypothetical protein [Acidovorax sp. sif0732]MBV7449249.1 hypothetical protein [Acidovorax sp. sif0715]
MRRFILSMSGVLLYIVIAVITYWLYIHSIKVDVVLYAAIWACCLALLVYAAIILALPFSSQFSSLEKAQNISICALIGYAMALTFPTVIDRSLSFYILEKLQQRGGGIQHQHLDLVFREEYFREHRLMDVRITEQMQSGTVFIDETNCLRLTSRGEHLASFSRFFRSNFLPPQRLISGTYSKDLIDPFAHKTAIPRYLCEK